VNQLPDYYRILQVDPEADAEVITAAFRVLARRLHPDRDISGVQEHRMAELNRAYSVLRDPEQRRQYDAEWKLMEPMGPGESPDRDQLRPRGGLSARMRAAAGAAEASTQSGAASDEMRLTFGRYTGMTLREIAARDVEYLRWLSRHSSGLRFRGEIDRILREHPQGSNSESPSR
jgi:curved DNA-binding protein CbpA